MSSVKQLELTTGEDLMYRHAKSPRAQTLILLMRPECPFYRLSLTSDLYLLAITFFS